jgi:hypothetical protein
MFFGWEGLMRVVLELEFEDRYRDFADQRDHEPNIGQKQV